MKYAILLIILLVAIVGIIISCTSKKNTIMGKAVEKPIVQLSKSKCFGRCKVYDLTIYDSQRMVYKGIKNVENMGSHVGNLSLKEYNRLIQSFKESNFSNFEASYLSSLKDIQSMKITYLDHQVKFHKRRAPKNLKQLLVQLDAVIDEASWTSMDVE